MLICVAVPPNTGLPPIGALRQDNAPLLQAFRYSNESPLRSSLQRPNPAVSAPSEAWRFLQGESPCRIRPNQPFVPSVAVVKEEWKKFPNETIEAYTGNHMGHKRDRTP
jgi:hypothetical protein